MKKNKLQPLFKRLNQTAGYSLIEMIISIGLCGFGFLIIFGLYGMALDAENTADHILNQSLEINSIRAEIEMALDLKENKTTADQIKQCLQNYPHYYLGGIKAASPANLYEIEIIYRGLKREEKSYFIMLYVKNHETF